MINELLAIFDEPLSDKSWIDIYGRQAITGKQKIGGSYKRFPLAIQNIDPECQDMTEHIKKLVPDDTKDGVAFWRALSPIRYSQINGIASARRLKKAEVRLQFVCWLNIRKTSAVNDSSNWSSVINAITKDAVKTLDCQNPKTPTGINGITNLKVQVTEIGDFDSWKAAMSSYTIENLEALTIWPFAGFTVNCTMSFIAQSECYEPFEASSEFDATGFCPPDNLNTMIITRNATPGELDGYPHYFPLSMLPDEFWDTTDGVLRVLDSKGHEFPHSIIEIDIPGKTGTLFFKTKKKETSKQFQINYGPGLTPHEPYDQFGSVRVWNNFDDVIFHETTDDYLILNHKKNYLSGLPNSLGGAIPTIPGLFETESVEFGDGFLRGIKQVNWRGGFSEFATPKTFLFAFKCTQAPGSTEAQLFSNYWNSIDGLYYLSLGKDGSDYSIKLTVCDNGANTIYQTQPGEFSDFALDTWFVVAVGLQEGAGGVTIDINKVSRPLTADTGIYPAQPDEKSETYTPITGVQNPSTGTFDFFGTLSAVMIYDGTLTKEQRDVFYDNWVIPGDFWTV